MRTQGRWRRGRVLGGVVACAAVVAASCAEEASPEDAGYWQVELCCGVCGHRRRTSVSAGDMRAFYSVVEGQKRTMAQTADELARERMSGWVDTFTGALERDLIDADDFAGPQQARP